MSLFTVTFQNKSTNSRFHGVALSPAFQTMYLFYGVAFIIKPLLCFGVLRYLLVIKPWWYLRVFICFAISLFWTLNLVALSLFLYHSVYHSEASLRVV